MGTAGSRFVEQDQSTAVSVDGSGRVNICLRTRKGPIGKAQGSPMVIRGYGQFTAMCGNPYPDNDDALIAKQALDRGVVLVVSRIVHATTPNDPTTVTAVKSNVTAQDRASAAAPAVYTSNAGPFNLLNGDDIHITVDASLAADIVLAGVQAHLDSLTVAGAGSFAGGKSLNVRFGQGAFQGPLQIISWVDGDFVDPVNPTATELQIAFNARAVGGSAVVSSGKLRLVDDIFGTASGVIVTGGSANVILGMSTVQQNGSGDALNLAQMTAAELKTKIDVPAIVGIVTSVLGSGATARLVITRTVSGATHGITFAATSSIIPKIGGATVAVAINGTDITTTTPTLIFYGKTEGVWADGLQFAITDNTKVVGTFDVSIPAQATVDTAEVHTQCVMDKTSPDYVVSRLLSASKVLNAVNQSSAKPAPSNSPQVGTYTLAGGNDGLVGLVAADYLGGSTSRLGVHAFDATSDSIDLMAPGLTDRLTQIQVAQYCEARADMVYYGNFPNPQDISDCIDFVSAQGAYAGQGLHFDTSYMAFHFDQPLEKDFTNVLRAMDGSGHRAGALVFNDTGGGKLITDYGPWFAPAGLKRAKINSQGVAVNIGSVGAAAMKQSLEDAQINSYADFGSGPILWDQRTQLQANSALKDLNVRRLLITVKKSTIEAVRVDEWDPNDPKMWRDVFRRLDPIMDQIKKKRGVYSYVIQCDQNAASVEDAVINNAIDIDAGKFKCLIHLKPTRAAREITLVGVISRTDANFTELLG